MKIGDTVRVINCRRSYNENGSIGRIVAEDGQTWIVEFRDGDSLMDYMPDELELVEE